MERSDFDRLVVGNSGLVRMGILSNNFAPYAAGEMAGLGPDVAFRAFRRGEAVPLDDKGNRIGDADIDRVAPRRDLPVVGAVGTTLLTENAIRSMSAKELDEAMSRGATPLAALAAGRGIEDEGGRSGTDNSLPGLTGMGATGGVGGVAPGGAGTSTASTPSGDVVIPDDWENQHHLQRVNLAKRLPGGADVSKASDADELIRAELARRAEADAGQ